MAFVAAVNPARIRPGLPEDGGRARPLPLALGSAAVLAAAAAGVYLAEPLLDALDVSPETFRLAAGLVMAVAAGWVLWFPHRGPEPAMAGLGAALVPVAFPLLVSPEVFVLAISAGADEPAPAVLGALAAALVAVNALGAVPRRGPADTLLRGVARLTAALLMVAALALIVSGIRDV